MKKSRFSALFVLIALVSLIAASLSACDQKGAPLPTDSGSWTLLSVVEEGEHFNNTYTVGTGAVYDGVLSEGVEDEEALIVDEDFVTVSFSGNAVFLVLPDGREIYGSWKKGGESMGHTTLIEYDFDGEPTYGTCGRVEDKDGKRYLQLYVVYGDVTFCFTAAG